MEALQPFGSSEGKGEGAEGYGDAKFDHVVRLDVRASAGENLRTVVREVGKIVGWETPSEGEVEMALESALGWKVTKKSEKTKDQEKEKNHKEGEKGVGGVRYFGLAVELDVRSTLDALFSSFSANSSSSSVKGEDVSSFYAEMRGKGRLNQRPHITLVHHTNLSPSSSLASGGEGESNEADRKWAFYTRLVSSSSGTGKSANGAVFRVRLSKVLYERGTLLTFPIDAVEPPPSSAIGEGKGWEEEFWTLHGRDWIPHITIATRDNEVRPYEANRVVAEWIASREQEGGGGGGGGEGDKVQVIPLPQEVVVEARVFGMT